MPTFRPALLAAALAALAGCSGSRPAEPALGPDGTPVVATWTADTLTLAQFDQAFAAADGALADSTQTPLERRLDFLDRYVDFRLKVLSARQSGYADDSTYQAEVEAYRDQLAGPYFLDRRVIDGIVQDLYDKQAEELEVSHLLLLLSPAASPADSAAAFDRATSIRDSIVAGHISFQEAAARYSEDPSAQQNQGDLGVLTGGRTVLPFEDAAYNTPVGQISEPVRTRFGVHLVQVNARRPARPEIGARHILIRTTPEVSVDSATAVIEELRARVLEGEDFGDLAREFSEDTGSGANGGALGLFGRGRMVAPFEAAAFALEDVGDVSGPVVTRFGVHLIQLTETPERPTLEDAYPELRRLAERLPRTALRRQALGREYIDEVGGRYDEALVREAVFQYGEEAARDSVLAVGFGVYGDREFASIGDSTYVLEDVLPTLRRTRFGPHPAGDMVEATRAFVEERAVERALARLEDRDPEFRRVFRSYADGVLLFRIAEDSVWTPAKEDEAGLRAYFDARPGQFRWPERRRVLAFRAETDSLLEAVGALLDRGMMPQAALGQFILASNPAQVRLDTVYVADSTGSALDAVLGLEAGERTGVITERGRRALYVFDALEAPRDKTFDEARAELITGYQEEVEQAWEARLRERYDAEVYPERVPAASSVAQPTEVVGTPTVIGGR